MLPLLQDFRDCRRRDQAGWRLIVTRFDGFEKGQFTAPSRCLRLGKIFELDLLRCLQLLDYILVLSVNPAYRRGAGY